MNKPKVEVLETYYISQNKAEVVEEVKKAVLAIYGYDLNEISSYLYYSEGDEFSKATNQSLVKARYPEEIMASVRQNMNLPNTIKENEAIMQMKKSDVLKHYFEGKNNKDYAEEAMQVILDIYGINLAQISNIEYFGISISSKGVWITQQPTDLFVIHSTVNDVGVKIYPTHYFTARTGLDSLPLSIVHGLESLGFMYRSDLNAYYYENPLKASVSDQFKGTVVRILLNAIHQQYSELVNPSH
ncbi:hypothetical protein ACFFGV_03740 [Pontibacillus salicampi]|uniref:Uncharacterized protein n=1 Tax=Pontibacillus salicampi TaxID=1449801 RepID=A0ABV6LJX5_9BACI